MSILQLVGTCRSKDEKVQEQDGRLACLNHFQSFGEEEENLPGMASIPETQENVTTCC